MHSYQPAGTKAAGSRATLASPQGVVGELAILYPAGVELRTVDRDILNDKYTDANGKPLPFEKLPKFSKSLELRWDMPPDTAATWIFAVRGVNEPAPQVELLDAAGRVVRVKLPDGRQVVAFLNIEPFRWSGEGLDFDGTVGLVIRGRDGRAQAFPIRADKLGAQ